MVKKEVSCNLISTATEVPDNLIPTNQILSSLGDKVSPELIESVRHLGVQQRCSAIENYSQYLAGHVDRKLLTNTTELGAKAVEKCITSAGIQASDICLLIAITNTSNRHLPCFGYEVMSQLSSLIPGNANVINMQNQGCSVFLKAIDIAQKYLSAKPKKYVVIVASETHTGLLPQLKSKYYFGFHELHQTNNDPSELLNSMTLVECCLFGDGAMACILGNDPAYPTFKKTTHLTDIKEGDVNLIHMDEGGVLIPIYKGFPHYVMSAGVPARGADYAKKSMQLLFDQEDGISSIDDADLLLIHTGSQKILTGVCNKIQIDPNSKKVDLSYEILRRYGNLSSTSIGFMIDHCIKEKSKGKALLVSFGVGFSASCGLLEFK